MKLKLTLLLFWALIGGFSARAGSVDTVQTYSAAMKKNIKAVVIKPDNYAAARALPVVYLLHGHGGDQANWISKVKSLQQAVDLYQILIVCPDGGKSSWYWDSPEDEKSRYETYVAQELVKWVDKNYKTLADKKGRAITGLSMGGHGALYLAFRNQQVFGAAGSMSGGVDIRPFPNNWGMAARLGKYAEKPENWEKHTVTNMLHLLTPNSLALLIDCGTEDFFYKVNVSLHEKMLERNIQHDFISRPGGHTWTYWDNAVQYQLLFMSRFFQQQVKS